MIRTEISPGVWLDSRRAIFIDELKLLVVSDVHWGYVDSHRAQGNLLPHWGDSEIERDLNALLADYQPAEFLWLGDSLHTMKGRFAAERFLESCAVPVTIIPGNHDARWKASFGNQVVVRGRYVFHHGDKPLELLSAAVGAATATGAVAHATGKAGDADDVDGTPNQASASIEVIGHHHPAFTWWDGAGGRLKIPAMVCGETRWILPAFSPWAAGTPWNAELTANEKLWVIAPKRIFAVTPAMLNRSRV